MQLNDNRLQNLFRSLEAHGDKIVFEDFINIIRTSGLLVEKALRGQLVLPDFINFSNKIDKIFKEVKNITSGDLASYIPPLAEVDPDQFGVAIVTTDGQIYQKGDSNKDFQFNRCVSLLIIVLPWKN